MAAKAAKQGGEGYSIHIVQSGEKLMDNTTENIKIAKSNDVYINVTFNFIT